MAWWLEQHVCYHTGEGSGGGVSPADSTAHQADHRKLVKVWGRRLDTMTVREKRKARPIIRFDIGQLGSSASVTRGDVLQHIEVATAQINHKLPPYLRISARHIRR